MKPLFIFAAVLAIAVAKPELYKEQEDFQYSRSSSDDGTKSGFYGAQRGNMGGNYERAHNMDSLAQNQMSGLVRQVEGELGDGAHQRTGSVYSAANSRGTYGSGHYDLSNLAGRNFQEGTSYANSHSSSSSHQSSAAHNSAAYSNSHSQSNSGSRYGGYRQRDAQTQTDDLQALDNAQTSNFYGYGAGRQSSHSTGYQASSGFQEHSEYDRSNANSQTGYGSNVHSRLISATPVRVVITPGGRVAIPIGVQTYTTAQGSSAYDQNALSEAETLSGNAQTLANRPEAKHYESSYKYHKQWEKHDTVPTTISLSTPTESTIPRNSELYEDNEAHRANNQYDARGVSSQNTHLSSASGRYNVKSGSSQSRYQSNYNAQENGASRSTSDAYTQTGYNAHNQGVSSDALTYTGARYHGATSAANLHTQTGYNAGAHTDLNSQVEDLNAKPKSYQSSYSYHKSWERQGDPYVIKPASSQIYDAQTSQRLTSATKNQRYATFHSGSQHNQGLADCDCDEYGNVRVARSIDRTEADDMEQQSVNVFEGQEQSEQAQNTFDFSQNVDEQQYENRWDNLQNFGQQSQSDFDEQNVGQESQSKWDNLQDLDQHSQRVGQHFENTWDNLQDFGQQSQSNFGQQNIEQQSQDKRENLEDLGQQSVANWGQIGDLGQQSEDQKTWDRLGDIAQQSSDQLVESLDQQTQNFLGHQEQDFVSQVINDNQQYEQHSQNEDQSQDNKRDLQYHAENENIHQFHTVENPWDKFDLLDTKKTEVTTEKNKLNNDPTTDRNDFYWHQILSSIGGMDQKVNNFDKESEFQSTNFDTKPNSQQFVDNNQQIYNHFASDNDYDKHYGYSGGFANPSVYNNPMPAYYNSFHGGEYGVQRWSSQDSNSYASSSWQQYEANAQRPDNFHNSQDSPLINFWGKFDNIEKETLSNTHDDTNHTENNITSIESSDSKILSVSDTIMATEKTNIVQTPEHNITSRPDSQTVSPQTQIKPSNMPEKAEDGRGDISDKEFENQEVPERPEDIGRGDIGPEGSSRSADAINKPYKRDDSITQHNNDNPSSDSELTVLSLEAQRENKDKILVLATTNSPTTLSNKRRQDNNEAETHNIETKQENVTTAVLQNVILPQQHANNFDQIRQQHDKIEQQNHYINWDNVPNIEQETANLEQQNVNTVGQENVNIVPQNVNKFEQNTLQDFGQQNVNVDQQHLTNFEPQNVPDSSQKNQKIWDNIDQGLEHLTNPHEQQTTSHFDDKTVTQQQYSLAVQNSNKEKNGIENESSQFEQQSTNFELQNQSGQFEQQTTNFEQQNRSGEFEQQTTNFEQQNQSGEFEQQNTNFEQQNQPSEFEQQNTNFEQQNQSGEFEQQNTNFEQQNQSGEFEQQNTNFVQQNQLSQFEQQNTNLEQKNQFDQFKQQNNSFEQQNAFSQFEQQNANFEQENQFEQQNTNFEQQNTNFEQQNPFGHFEHQNANFEQQNQFGEDLVGKHFGQSEDNLEHFGQHHEPLEQDKIESFSQSQSMQDFELQKENIHDQNLNKFGQQSENMDDLKHINIPQETEGSLKYALQQHQHPEINEELIIPKEYKNTQSNIPKSSDVADIDPPIEPTTEKPGFWKSVGSKFSSAKNKVVSWFSRD